jgi:small subunit ribosomal protein S11
MKEVKLKQKLKTKTLNKNLNNKRVIKKKNFVEDVILCITATSNNSILTLTNEIGEALTQLSCGSVGFKNTKKSTPFAFQTALDRMIERMKDFCVRNVKLKIHTTGITQIREHLSVFTNSGFNITKIIDITSKNHNGPRPPRQPKK